MQNTQFLTHQFWLLENSDPPSSSHLTDYKNIFSAVHICIQAAGVHSPTAPAWEGVLPADSKASPFSELDLMELWDGIGKTRVRQHVNPLKLEFQRPLPPVDWSSVYENPHRRLVLDLGCGYGRFLLLMQQRQGDPEVNYLGIEIRQSIVERANQWAERLGCQKQTHFVYANATTSLQSLLSTYPGPVSDILIQFPDPHFKRKHRKRRIFQPSLVATIAQLLPSGGRLLLQSDVLQASVAMRNIFEKYASHAFQPAPQHSEPGAVFFEEPQLMQPLLQPAQLQRLGQPIAGSTLRHSGTTAADPPSVQSHDITSGHTSSSKAAVGSGVGSDGDSADLPVIQHQQLLPPCIGQSTSVLHNSTTTRDDTAATAREQLCAVRHSAEISQEDSTTAVVSDDDADHAGEEPVEKGDADNDYDRLDSQWRHSGWLRVNPIGIPTEREHYVMQKGLPVYRLLLVRK